MLGYSHRLPGLLYGLPFASLLLFGLARADETKPAWPPYGIDKRIPWNDSRVVGSPDPAAPFRVEKVFPDLKLPCPIYLRQEPGTNNFFLIQQTFPWGGACRIHRFQNRPDVAEAELLLARDWLFYGLTFHPQYEQNGYVYVVMNGPLSAERKHNRVVRFTVARQAPFALDEKSELVILDWESNGHNGGELGFGPDGMLYIPTGDGTSDSDTIDSGQGVDDLLAVMIRIDVDHPDKDKPYSVPADNPFSHLPGARPEVWAFGFRNPWRMTFDPKTGHLWVGNNGQDLWEQVFFVRKGDNYGWSVYEGSHPFQLDRKRGPAPIVKPACEHHHTEFRSLTGGVVYHGTKLPGLAGTYLYGDFSTGRIWGARHDGERVTWNGEVARTTLQITGFANSHDGEDVLICDHGSGIYRLVPTPKETVTAKFPTRLSETGLFSSVAEHRVHPALIPYSVQAEVWADGAKQERWLALPGTEQIEHVNRTSFTLPNSTVLMKTLTLELEPGKPRRIETQLLTRQSNEWAGYAYAWNDEQSDAVLVAGSGADRVLKIVDPSEPTGVREQTWHFASRTECMACHSRAAGFVDGFTPLQINRFHDYGSVRDSQLRTLEHLGVFKVNWLSHWDEARDTIRRVEQTLLVPEKASILRIVRKISPTVGDIATKLTRDSEQFRPLNWNLVIRTRDRYLADFRKELTDKPRFVPILARRSGQIVRLVNPHDPTAELDARARSYLHANCSHCHTGAGGGNSLMELTFQKARKDMHLFNAKPQHDPFLISGAKLFAPGDPYRSVLLYRMSKLGSGRMPRIGSTVVDERGVALIRDWIAAEKPTDDDGAIDAVRVAATKKLDSLARLPVKQAGPTISELLASTSSAMQLVHALDSGRIPSAIRTAIVEQAKAHDLPPTRDLLERFVPTSERVKRLGSVVEPGVILELTGNADRGRQLFLQGAGVACRNCHRIGPGDAQVGPELTMIGKKLNREQLLESILDPSRTIDEKFRTYNAELSDGRLLTGILVERTAEAIVIRDPMNKEFRVATKDVDQLTPQRKSLMPELLVRDLTAQQVADLIEFLGQQK